MAHQPVVRRAPDSDTAVVFVHGIVGTPDQFSTLLPLVPAHWSVDNLLLPGHGGSVTDFSRSSMAQWRSHVSAHIDALASSHRRILLVGHSMGTLFCIDEALRRPQVQGLFLMASPLRIGLHPSAITQALQVAFGIEGRTDAQRAARAASSIRPSRRLWQYLGWIPRYLELFQASKLGRQQIKQVRIPCVAVQSRQDEMVAFRSCRHLETPHIALHVLPNARHFYYPPEDLALLRQYFRRILRTISIKSCMALPYSFFITLHECRSAGCRVGRKPRSLCPQSGY